MLLQRNVEGDLAKAMSLLVVSRRPPERMPLNKNRLVQKLVDKPWTIGLAGCQGLSREGQEAGRFEANTGGGSGIRTHDTVTRIAVFKTAAFVRSAIPPLLLAPVYCRPGG